jgi:hypothetical protein
MAGASHEAGSSTGKPIDDPESTIEINIKTLDSRVHKLRVHKNVRFSLAKLAFFLSVLSVCSLWNSSRIRRFRCTAMFGCDLYRLPIANDPMRLCFWKD